MKSPLVLTLEDFKVVHPWANRYAARRCGPHDLRCPASKCDDEMIFRRFGIAPGYSARDLGRLWLTAVLLASCTHDATRPVPPRVVTQVQITGPDTVLYGAPVLLRARAFDADGAEIDGVRFDWQVDSTSRTQGGSVDESGRLSYATRQLTTPLSVRACAITTTFCAAKSVTARDSFSISTPRLPTAITIGDVARPTVTVVDWKGDTVVSEHPVVMTTGSTDSSGTAVVDASGVVHVVGFGHVDLVARLFRHDTVIAESSRERVGEQQRLSHVNRWP